MRSAARFFSRFVTDLATSSRNTISGAASQPSFARNLRLVRITEIPARRAASSATSAPALKLITAGVRSLYITPSISDARTVQFGINTPT